MTLTEEQKERMRINRERALEIRRKKLEEAARKQQEEDAKNRKGGESNEEKKNVPNKEKLKDDADVELEDFEIDASPYVTKQDAMSKYCLPIGTLEVCEFIEKDNPRNKKFSKMKLYYRSEIRRRARERFGGLQGLQEERRKRERKRFERDYEDVTNIFKSSKKKKSSNNYGL